MAKHTAVGHPGNQMMTQVGSTYLHPLGYGLTFRRPVFALSTATGYQIRQDQSGAMFTYGGAGSGVTISLPPPEPGLWFEFAATGAITSSPTVIRTGHGVIIDKVSSAGATSLTGNATTWDFAAAQGGGYVEIVGLSTAAYLARTWSGGASVASTGAMLTAT